jgi:ketosteroid isomerase-like protein
MADESKVLEVVKRYFEYVGADVDRAEEIYHDDAVLEFPQSGERFEGVATFTEWRRQYPADMDKVRFELRRVTVREDLAVVELRATYDGESWLQGVQLLEFRSDKVVRERIYVAEAWEAPEWRARWRSATPADPAEELSPLLGE